jgi:hypothetical protein
VVWTSVIVPDDSSTLTEPTGTGETVNDDVPL